uniref:DUF4219 domain-containing protein n=1 Tax=Oryza brachyantha TaxID=4533 RepID=J3LVD2_ORYBR
MARDKSPVRTPQGGGSDVSAGVHGGAMVAARSTGKVVFMHYLMLSDTNYGVWAIKMKLVLHHLAVPDAGMMAITDKDTAKEAWEAIEKINIGEDRVKNGRLQALKRRFDRLYMEDSETIAEFSPKLTALVGEMCSLGGKVKDRVIVKKLFSAVPDKFLQIGGTIEQ